MGRRLFLVGLVIFTAGSLACALATTALALELFRALQGVGGVAATVPPAARAAVIHAAHAGTASGLNDVLLAAAAAAFASLGAIVGFGFGPDPARQPPPRPA